MLTVRVSGTVEKKDDEFAAPTVSIPLIPTLALFWEKCGITRDHALRMLREAITEAMLDGVKEDDHIQSHIKDVDAAIKAVRTRPDQPTSEDAAQRARSSPRISPSPSWSATEQPVLAVA